MGRGPKPAKSKEAKPPGARTSPKDDGAKVRDLQKRLAEALQRENEGLKREAEAEEQQAARAGIRRGISSSPTDIQFRLPLGPCAPFSRSSRRDLDHQRRIARCIAC